jgi:hypothetical protein
VPPVTAINIYGGATTATLLKTAVIYTSTPIDLPKPISTGAPVKPYLTLLSEPVIIPPGGLIALEAVVNPAFSDQVDVFIMWIPSIVLTSRSTYIAALAPRFPPMT